uniref:GtrA family protein n=1 Tax=Polynucleobacter sp. TaxID=2029855 RepID=UPI004048D901
MRFLLCDVSKQPQKQVQKCRAIETAKATWGFFWCSWRMSNLNKLPKNQGSFKQFTRYAFVGIVSNLAGYLSYLLVIHFGGTPKIAMTFLYGVVAIIGYFANRNFTFSYRGSVISSGIRYCIAHFFGYLINLFALIIFVDYFNYPHQWVQAIAIFVVAGFLFISFKLLIFKKS